MDTLLQDIRFSLRTLLKSPLFTLVTLATVAAGISATTVVFSLINALLLRPLPVQDPEQLVSIHERRSGWVNPVMAQSGFSYQHYLAYREAAHDIFSGVVAQRPEEFSVRTNFEPWAVSGILASSNYFQVLGVRPTIGRFFSTDGREVGNAERVAVISYSLWQERFNGEPSVIGRTLYVDGRPFTVVGVAPRGFFGTAVGMQPHVWVPATAYWAGSESSTSSTLVALFGRLRHGTSSQAAAAALRVVGAQIPPEPGTEFVGVRVDPIGMPSIVRGDVVAFLNMLLAAAALVLLIAATNVAGMMLARAAARQREVAVRVALGAGRSRIARQLITESVLLFLAGGSAGVLLAVWLTSLLGSFQSQLAEDVFLDLGLDGRVLAFALLLSLVVGTISGVAPAIQASSPDLVPKLRDNIGGPAGRSRLRSSFVVAQVAMALVLLVTAGLLVRALRSALGDDIGFDPNGVVVAQIDLAPHGYDQERARIFFDQLLERLRAVPGVEAAGLGRFAPMSGENMAMLAEPLSAADQRRSGTTVGFNIVDSGYFQVLHLPIIAGRQFADADRPGGPPVVLINETLAERFWPGENPVGKRLSFNGEVREVVGVVSDAMYKGYSKASNPFLYVPFSQQDGYLNLVLHVRMPSAAVREATAAIRREMATLNPNIAVEQPFDLTTLVGSSLFPQRLGAWLIGVFGMIGLLLAALGIYGVLAFSVARRTREIGLRMALGAHSRDVLWLVVRQGLTLVAVGLSIGLLVAFITTRLLNALLYGVSATDPLAYSAVPLLLTAAALAASYIPARRATRVDPMASLRTE